MKKIILNEKQVDKLMNKVVSEQQSDDGRYRIKVECEYESYGVKFQGQEVDEINGWKDFTVTYMIDQEHRSYGITTLSPYAFSGPKEVELEIDYYNGEDEHTTEVPMTVSLDWDKVTSTRDEDIGYIGMSSFMSIVLMNDQEGNIVVKEINITYNGI